MTMGVSAAELEAFARLPAEQFLLRVLLQLAALILVSRVVAMAFRRFGQPEVVGEIAAGILLGPSLFGWLLPDAFGWLFRPEFAGVPVVLSNGAITKVFSVLSQLGLIFLLFLVGLEFDFHHVSGQRGPTLLIASRGLLAPLALGVGLARVMLPHIEEVAPGKSAPALGFTLFLGVALSITALPVLGRMMVEWNITRTRLGAITITAAAGEDVAGWVLLASVAAVVRGEFDAMKTAQLAGLSVAYTLFMLLVARPLLRRWAAGALRRGGGELALGDLAVLIVILLFASLAMSLIGLFDVFGAFLLGAVLSGDEAFRAAVSRRLRDFVTAFFLPVFFTYTGLRTDVRSLGSAEVWLLGGLLLASAVVGKLAGCGLGAWAGGFSRREAALVGAMMNARGLLELVVANLGLELRVIPRSVYCMLVIMALITTFMTTPIVRRLARGTELEEPIRQSGFFGAT